MFETLISKLQEDKYLTLETTPQHEPSMHNIVEKIKKFKIDSKVDGFTCTDNPLAKLKYNSLFAALKHLFYRGFFLFLGFAPCLNNSHRRA